MSFLTVSNHAGIGERSATTLKFLRPITESNNYKYAAPGARVSFVTDSDVVGFRVYWNALITRLDTFNSVASVLVNGVEVGSFSAPYAADASGESYHRFTVSGAEKTVTLVWPMAAGMELRNVGVRAGASFRPSPSVSSSVLVVAGDSISMGLQSTKTTTSWPYLLAVSKGYELKNIANGSEQAVGANGSAVSGLNASFITYMIGFNNFVANTNTTTFKNSVKTWITNARAAAPSAKIYLISPIYSTKVAADYGHSTELSSYRTAVQDAETEAGDANTFFVDGLSIMTNNAGRLADGIHPNDTGASDIQTALGLLIA